MGADEEATLKTLDAYRDIIDGVGSFRYRLPKQAPYSGTATLRGTLSSRLGPAPQVRGNNRVMTRSREGRLVRDLIWIIESAHRPS